jgi:NADH dehydrogenase FAD-containing subunit
VILRTGTGTGIDVAGRAVLIGERRIPDDQPVIATGARESYFGHNEWAAVMSGLKTIEDATPMRRPILSAFERAESCADEIERQRQLTLVIIGGGPTGVELAGTLAELAKAALACDFRHIDPTTARIVLIGAGPPDRVPQPDGGGDRLLWSYGPDEDPLIIDIGPPAGQLADEITRLLGASVTIL